MRRATAIGTGLALMLATAGAAPPRRAAMVRTVKAELDPQLTVRRLSEQRLTYRAGADPKEDRPGHVRAASGLGWFGGRLAIAQDDAGFVGLWDPATRAVESLALPRGPGGLRQFEKARKNKMDKLDLEAAAVARGERGETLALFGSGSAPVREVVVRVTQGKDGPAVRVDRAPAFYAALRARHEFSGSEMNIEGAAILPDGRLRLFQRGNGAPKDGRLPVNATVEVSWPELEAYLDGARAAAPELGEVVRYELGEVAGVKLSFTDATPAPEGRLLFTASAEASPDAIEDGEVVASAIGVIEPSGRARYGLLVDEKGAGLKLKLEGIALDPHAKDQVLLVADPDDPKTAAALVRAALAGPWF